MNVLQCDVFPHRLQTSLWMYIFTILPILQMYINFGWVLCWNWLSNFWRLNHDNRITHRINLDQISQPWIKPIFTRLDRIKGMMVHNFGLSGITRLRRRRRQIFFTSSMPHSSSTPRSFWQRAVSWYIILDLSFICAQMTNGNPKRALYIWLSRAMCDASSELSASIPAAACSSHDSRVSVPRWRSLPARSGWHLRIPSLPGHKRNRLYFMFSELQWHYAHSRSCFGSNRCLKNSLNKNWRSHLIVGGRRWIRWWLPPKQ